MLWINQAPAGSRTQRGDTGLSAAATMQPLAALLLLLPLLSVGAGGGPAAGGRCSLRPGEPKGYRIVCDAAANATACRMRNISCEWTPPHAPPAP